MPKLDKIFRRVVSPLPVGRTDRRTVLTGSLVIDENEGKVPLGQRTDKIGRAAGQNQQETIYHPFCQVRNISGFLACHAMGRIENKIQIGQTELGINSSYNL